MKLLTGLVSPLIALAMVSSVSAVPNSEVAKLINVKGKVIVENAKGIRQMARSGMSLAEGSHIIILEKASAQLAYKLSQCSISHDQNTLLKVAAKAQCAAGQQIAVGAAAASASAGAGAGTATAGTVGVAGAAGAGAAGAGAAAAAGVSTGLVAAVGIGVVAVGVGVNESRKNNNQTPTPTPTAADDVPGS